MELGQVRSIDNERVLQILLSFAVMNFKGHHSSTFTHLCVLVFHSSFAPVFYHVSFVLQKGCVYSIMVSFRSKVQVRT